MNERDIETRRESEAGKGRVGETPELPRHAAAASPRRFRWRRQIQPTILHIVLLIGAIPILIPFYWMLVSSVQSKDRTDQYPPQWVPIQTYYYATDENGVRRETFPPTREENGKTQIRFMDQANKVWVPTSAVQKVEKVEPRWKNISNVFAKTGDTSSGSVEDKPFRWSDIWKAESYGRYALNTLVLALLCVYGQIISCSLVAFGFARMRFWGKNALFLLMLATMMIPGQIYAIPAFMIYKWLGWVDTYLPLIVPAWMGGAFFVFLFRQFFMGIPLEMDEAARIDGAGPFRVWWEILLPMAKPVAVVAGVYTFFGAWNDLFGPLIYINSDFKRTLALALTKFSNAYGQTDVPSLMAASALMMLPVLIIFFFSQKALQQGLVISGVKG
ncbi:MAG TPA: carbohydrate ABC transporter permease [Armatimonadota bacterium]|jgi:ABC-type glycerol-3-phosphate transport system permease component